MSYIIIDVIFNIIAYWILVLIMQYIWSAHFSLNKKEVLFCTVISGVSGFILADYIDLCIPAQVLLTVLIFSTRKIKDMLLFFPTFAMYLILAIIPECILDELLPKYNKYFYVDGQPANFVSMTVDIVLLACLLVLRYILTKYQTSLRLNKKETVGCIGLFFLLMLDGALIMATNHSNMPPVYIIIWKTIFLGIFLFCVAYYFYSIIESRTQIYRQTISRSETEYLRVQLDSLQNVKESEAQVKHLRHDLNNHLSVIQTLCEDGNYDAVKKYTKQLRNNIVLSGAKILTGNNVADMIIRSKMKIAQEHNISFEFTGSLENLAMMDAPDICGLFANAYDNAIEACIPQSNAYINTRVSSTSNYTVIEISNSTDKKIAIRSNSVATTKADKSSHGYGIDIMKRIANKYNGNCTLHSAENEFIVKIVLLKI